MVTLNRIGEKITAIKDRLRKLFKNIYILTKLELMEEMKSTAVVVGACPWDRSRLKTILEKGNFKILGEASWIEQAIEFVNKFSDVQFIFQIWN